MRSSLLAPLLALLVVPYTAFARSTTGDRVLVVLDTAYDRADYSRFFTSLEERGFTLTFAAPTDKATTLNAYGEPTYDHLILFAPEAKAYAPKFTPQEILGAQATHLNTLQVLSPGLVEVQRDTLREYDIEASDAGLVDAFSHASEDASAIFVPRSSFVAPAPVLSPSTLAGAGPLVFPGGAAHTTGLNPFLIDVVKAPKTAYVASEDVKGGKEVLAGSKATLVSAMQNRENVRVGFVGSAGMLSDKWWGAKVDGVETANREVIEDFTKWLFQETGVVRVVETTHHRDGETEPREVYRKKEDVTFSITLAQHSTSSNGSSVWAPFSVSDLQLEFTMLDPHIRTALVESGSSASSTTYTASLRAPDRHGVFKFIVSYWRPGWTYIQTADKASVVPLRHDQYPRWIVGAFPFYTGALSTSAAFVLFTALWISLGEGDKTKGKKE